VELRAEREELAAACHRVAEEGLVIGTAGNLSIRSGDLVVLTPTGGVLGGLTPEMMSVVDFDGQVVDGELAPTSEIRLHLGIYRQTTAQAVAHAHAQCSTAVACTKDELPAIHYTILELGGPIRVAPYATFGSEELAANVTAAMKGRQAALMQNHGSVAHGPTIGKAVDSLMQLEWLAELYCRSLTIGEPRIVSDAELEAVIMHAITNRYGATHRVDDA
jgi:L-fuculose-phosphate aldolase